MAPVTVTHLPVEETFVHPAGAHTLALHLAIVTHWLSRENGLKAVLSTPALTGGTLSPSHPQDPVTGTTSLLASLWVTLQMAGTTAPTLPPHAPTRMVSFPGWSHLLGSRGLLVVGGAWCEQWRQDDSFFFPSPSPMPPHSLSHPSFPSSLIPLSNQHEAAWRNPVSFQKERDTGSGWMGHPLTHTRVMAEF